MILKVNNPELDFKNADLFGMTPNAYAIQKNNSEKQKNILNKQWRDKDVTPYILRPINRLTRRELKAVKDLIENPEDFEKLKEKHSVMKEDEVRFNKFDSQYEVLRQETIDFLVKTHNRDILRKLITLKTQDDIYLNDPDPGMDYEEMINKAKPY